MLTINNLTFGYKKKSPLFNNISFCLCSGTTILVGENGSGKSTLIKILSAEINSKARIAFNGKPLSNIERKSIMAYLPQEYDVYPSLKVNDLLRFVAKAKGVSDVETSIHDIVKKTNIEEFGDKKIKHCSVGTRRRVGIASAMLGNPQIVILDEPTAGIDPRERVRFYQIIKDCFAGKIVLIATHILDDIDVLADGIIMLSKGQIVFDGEYSIFRHVLDDYLYEITATELSKEESAAINSGVILSQRKQNSMNVWRVVIPNSLSPDLKHFKKVSPTLEDLWEYFQKRDTDGKMG